MIKEFTTLDILNVMSWYNDAKDRMSHFPVKLQWYLKQNIDAMRAVGEKFSELRNELADKLQADWFASDKAEDYTDEESGEAGRKIKSEFEQDYEDAVAKCNAEIGELLDEKNEINIVPFDVDAYVDSLSDDVIGDEHTLRDLNVIAMIMKGQK